MTVNPQMIALAREAEGMTQAALAHSAGVSQSLLSRVEHGLDAPTPDLASRLAKELDVPEEFFAQTDAVLGEGVVDFFHRKRMTLPAKPLKKAHATANLVRIGVLRLLNSVELTGVKPFPEYLPEEHGSPADVARLVRATWRIPSGPLPNLIGLVEATGTPVVLLDLGHEKLRGISMPGFAGRHLILLNDRLPASLLRFTLAHEIGHLVMHRGVATEDLERDADEFASELLMPAADIRTALRSLRFRDLGALKAVWRVSLAALIRSAYNLGELTERQYRYFNMQLNQLPGGRKQEPGEFEKEQPRLLRSIMDEYYRDQLGYSRADLAKMMLLTEQRLGELFLGEPASALRAVGRGENVYRFPVDN